MMNKFQFLWWGFNRKAWQLPEFHPIMGFHQFSGPGYQVWKWIVWVGPLTMGQRVDGPSKQCVKLIEEQYVKHMEEIETFEVLSEEACSLAFNEAIDLCVHVAQTRHPEVLIGCLRALKRVKVK